MAGIAMMISGALTNAFAFTGSNFLFSMFGNKRVDEERIRHDKAIEQLQRARDRWTKKRTERMDYIKDTLQREYQAVAKFKDVDSAMQEYYIVTGKTDLAPLDPKPELSDYYKPSSDQKTRELIFVAVGVGATGLITYKMFY